MEDLLDNAVSLGAGIPETPDQFIFLGVAAHVWRNGGVALRSQAGDVLKLGAMAG